MEEELAFDAWNSKKKLAKSQESTPLENLEIPTLTPSQDEGEKEERKKRKKKKRGSCWESKKEEKKEEEERNGLA